MIFLRPDFYTEIIEKRRTGQLIYRASRAAARPPTAANVPAATFPAPAVTMEDELDELEVVADPVEEADTAVVSVVLVTPVLVADFVLTVELDVGELVSDDTVSDGLVSDEVVASLLDAEDEMLE